MKYKFLYFILIVLTFLNFFISGAFGDFEVNKVLGLTSKMKREIKIMEERHFKNKVENEDDNYRIKRLEIELLGNSYEDLPLERRIEVLKLASQKRMVSGMSIPKSFHPSYTRKRMENDSIEIVKTNNVGIIDGLLRLYAPDFYEQYKNDRERYFEMYGD